MWPVWPQPGRWWLSASSGGSRPAARSVWHKWKLFYLLLIRFPTSPPCSPTWFSSFWPSGASHCRGLARACSIISLQVNKFKTKLLTLKIKLIKLDHINEIHLVLWSDWVRLADVGVWVDAATQVIFSLGPACGCVITLSSYNKFTRDCHRDAVLIALTNSVTSLFSGSKISDYDYRS